MRNRTSFGLAAIIMLSACDGVTTYGKMQTRSPIPESLFLSATKQGAIVTEVRGNPFSIPDDQFATMVREHLQGANFTGPPVRFSAAAGDQTVTPYKVVVMFNPLPADRYNGLCGTATAPTSKGQDATRMTMSMAFCQSAKRISGTWGSVGGVTGPDDPKFRALIRETALTLVPIYRDDQNSE